MAGLILYFKIKRHFYFYFESVSDCVSEWQGHQLSCLPTLSGQWNEFMAAMCYKSLTLQKFNILG